MDALTPKTIDLTPLIPILWALSLCIMGTFLKHSILLIKVILGKVIGWHKCITFSSANSKKGRLKLI